MAEFCLKCWNKLNNISLTEKDVVISKDLYLCEGCAKYQKVILVYERKNLFKKFIRRITKR